MQKIVATKPHAAVGLGALLLRKMGRTPAVDLDTPTSAPAAGRAQSPSVSSSIKPADLAFAKRVAERAVQQRDGMFGPMFALTKARNELAKTSKPTTAGKKPTPAAVPVPTMRPPGENIGADFNPDDPRHVHARQLHESAAAHAALIASVKAALNPGRGASTGPVAI